MKNNKILLLLTILAFIFNQTKIFADIFNFETSEIKILEKGNLVIASNGGKVFTNDNVEIKADSFNTIKLNHRWKQKVI